MAGDDPPAPPVWRSEPTSFTSLSRLVSAQDEINSFLLEQTAADEAGRSDSSDESVEDDAEMEAAFMSEMAGGSGKRKQAGSTGKAAKRVKKPAVFHTGTAPRRTVPSSARRHSMNPKGDSQGTE